jgi:magnesium transporter
VRVDARVGLGQNETYLDIVRCRIWRNGTLEAENFPFEQISDYICQPDCLVWVDLLQPSPARLAALADELSLDPHAIEDATSPHERPKAVRYNTHLFMSAYAIKFNSATAELDLSNVSVFGLLQGIVTVRLDDQFDIDKVVQRWDDNSDLLKFGSRALAHGLLDEIIDEYFVAITGLDDEIEKLEDELFDEIDRRSIDVQRHSYEVRKSLLHARRAILPMREVVTTVMRRVTEDGHNELTPYYEDLYDHILRAGEWTDSLRDLLGSIFETNLSLADQRMNIVMKKLTSWAAIIAVPTAITGYFGQNIPYPGFGHEWGFVLSTGAIALIAFALYLTFRKKDWL